MLTPEEKALSPMEPTLQEPLLDVASQPERNGASAALRLTAASVLLAGVALGASGCLKPSEAPPTTTTIETLSDANMPAANVMLESFQRAMSGLRHSSDPVSTRIAADDRFSGWAIAHNIDPQPGGTPQPGDVVLTTTGRLAIVYEVTTTSSVMEGTKTTITSVGGGQLDPNQISRDGRALLPVPESDPPASTSKGNTPTASQTPSTPNSPTPAHSAPETRSFIAKERAAVVRTIEAELRTHAGQSPYDTVGGKSVWPELLDYINKNGSALGKDPNWCAFMVSFLLEKSGHPLSGGDASNPSALYRVYNIPGVSTPIKAMTLQQWVLKNGSYWSYGQTGKRPQPGDILFFSANGDGVTMDHTGIVLSMEGDTLTYAAGNDGNNLSFNEDKVNINALQENGVLVAIGDPLAPGNGTRPESGSAETPPLDPNMLKWLMISILEQESSIGWSTPPNAWSASGGFQVTKSLWNNYGGYPEAYLAPPQTQWEFAKKTLTGYYQEYYAHKDMDSLYGKLTVWQYLAGAWYAGPGFLSPQALAKNSIYTRQNGGQYPSIDDYMHKVVNGGGNHPGQQAYARGVPEPNIPGLSRSIYASAN